MRWISAGLVAVLVAGCARRAAYVLPSSPLQAERAMVAKPVPPPRPQERVEATRLGRVTLAFTDAPVRDVLHAIARAGGGNIVLAPDVEGRITVAFHDVPWNEAVEAVAKTVGRVEAIWERPNLVRIVDP